LRETQGFYGPRAYPPRPVAKWRARLGALALPSVHGAVRGAAMSLAFSSTLAIAALNAHAPLDIHPGVPGRMLAAYMPLAAALAAAFAVRWPWPGFLAILFLTPCWDAAQVSWQVGPIQVILQTVFVAWLAAGYLLRDRKPARTVERRAARPIDRPATGRVQAIEFASRHLGPLAAAGVLVLASLSTLVSPNPEQSATVLVHGIFEPVAMGLLLLAFRPNRRQLMLLLAVLGLSVALGGLINVVQSVPAYGTLGRLQTYRLLFSRLTYFNVGLFGEMLAMAAPLLLGAIVFRRQLGLGRYSVPVAMAALGVGAVSLFLTFSKSAYLATAGGVLVFLLLLVRTRRARLQIVAGALLLSALVVPWPALVLQVSPTLSNVYRDAMVGMMGPTRYNSWDPSSFAGHGSLVERASASGAAVAMAADHPLLGVGLDQFGSQWNGPYDSAHTFWPEVAAELGIPALVLVVLIFASALLALWRIYRAPPDAATRLLAVTLLASLAAWIVVATAFAGDMYRPWRNMSSDFVMMAVLTAAAFALARAVRASQPKPAEAGAAEAEAPQAAAEPEAAEPEAAEPEAAEPEAAREP
jgi:O-antigen ligase